MWMYEIIIIVSGFFPERLIVVQGILFNTESVLILVAVGL
jgi:hypothetical protein